MLLLTSLLILIVILLYIYSSMNFNYWKERNVTYIKPFPLFGNVFKVLIMKTDIGTLLEKFYKSSSEPYVGYFIFNKPTLLIRDPQLIKLILIKDFQYFSDRYIARNEKYDIAAYFLFVIRNPAWRTLRKDMVSFYKSSKIKKMVPVMNEVAKKMLNVIAKSASLDESIASREMCMSYSTDITTSCAYSITSEDFKKSEYRVISKRIFNWNSICRILHTNFYFIAPFLVKIFKLKFMEPVSADYMTNVLNKAISERKKDQVIRGDIIDHLIKIKQKYANMVSVWDDEMILYQAIQFYFAGFETTGSTLSYALHELSLNKSVQQQLRTEIQNVYNEHNEISYDAILDMKYLDMVILETLRKYPILPFLSRYCNRNYRVPYTDLVIEKGVGVYISLLGLHYDPVYYPEPEKFIPERFSAAGKSSRPSSAYLAFGEGPRDCIGKYFGLIASKVGLIYILLNYEVIRCEKDCTSKNFNNKGFLLAPEGDIDMYFKPLKNLCG